MPGAIAEGVAIEPTGMYPRRVPGWNTRRSLKDASLMRCLKIESPLLQVEKRASAAGKEEGNYVQPSIS